MEQATAFSSFPVYFLNGYPLPMPQDLQFANRIQWSPTTNHVAPAQLRTLVASPGTCTAQCRTQGPCRRYDVLTVPAVSPTLRALALGPTAVGESTQARASDASFGEASPAPHAVSEKSRSRFRGMAKEAVFNSPRDPSACP